MNAHDLPTLKPLKDDADKKFTLRYKKEVPFNERPHAPTVPMFDRLVDCLEWQEEQENAHDLEVVRR